MKKIAFFARLRLTNLYVKLFHHFNNEFEILFIAYSDEEERIIRRDAAGANVINFKKIISKKIVSTNIDLEKLQKIDQVIKHSTSGRFCLNSSIQSDRSFQFLKYSEVLKLSQVYFDAWTEIIQEYKFDYFMHEHVSLHMNHIASVVCKVNGTKYVSEIPIRGFDNYNFIISNFDEGISEELINEYNKISKGEIDSYKDEIHNFINLYRVESSVFFANLIPKKSQVFKLLFSSIYNEIKLILIRKNKLIEPIDYFLVRNRTAFKKLINLTLYKFFVRWDDFVENEDFYYYPLHLEPEAVVLYMADGLYKNQIKLIENIAAQLPVGKFLYVKDHPHSIGYRNFFDYRALNKIPNIKLLDARIPGTTVIKNSTGVITLNGTSGIEALMINKRVFTFGKAYYNLCPLVTHVPNVKDFGKLIDYNSNETQDNFELNRFVLALLRSMYKGNTDCFYGPENSISRDDANIIDIAESYRRYFRK